MVTTANELERYIEDFVQRLERGITVDLVILFGSYARGAAHEWSDIDLAVISRDFENLPLWQRQELIAKLSLHRAPNMSPLGYPSSQYHNPGPHSFLREIIRTGKVVYPRGHS